MLKKSEYNQKTPQLQITENSLDNVLLFCSPQLILRFTEGVQLFITEKTILFQGPRGGPTFSGGGGGGFSFFQEGVQMLISIKKTPYNL